METYCTCGKSGASIYCNGNCNPQTITTDSTDIVLPSPADGVDEAAGKYLMDTDHVWGQEIRNAFKAGALWQSRQRGVGRTLQECKDEVATKYLFRDWKEIHRECLFRLDDRMIGYEDLWEEAAELYASQNPQP